MDIFIIRDGRQSGPYSEDAVKAFLTEGTARPTDPGWRKGMVDWRALSEVLKSQPEQESPPATPPAEAPAPTSNGTAETYVPATAKQKAFLKYLGAEFGENLTKERAALAVSDALETPKLQPRIRKWHDEKLRQHPEVFQDEIDYRKANRTNRYLERIQTEGSEVLTDVTKAHVQVLVESLDKRHPGWESERESALWDYLLPAVGEHFPQLVLPAYKARLKVGGTARVGSSITRGMGSSAGVLLPPPQATGTLGAMMRGVALGVIALGAIVFGRQVWQDSQNKSVKSAPAPASEPAPAVADKKEAPAPQEAPAPKEPAAPLPEKILADAKPADPAAEAPATVAAPAIPQPAEPSTPAAPPMTAEKPAPPEEKPAAPVEPAPMPAPPAPPAPPAAPRAVVSLTQGIGVNLPNGQVALPAGTQLRYLGTEGPNIRVSWNNNIFFVPALATDVNEPVPAPGEPPANPAMTPPGAATPPAAPSTTNPKKPADDL